MSALGLNYLIVCKSSELVSSSRTCLRLLFQLCSPFFHHGPFSYDFDALFPDCASNSLFLFLFLFQRALTISLAMRLLAPRAAACTHYARNRR